MAKPRDKGKGTAKDEALEPFRDRPEGSVLTTDQGVGIPHTDDSLKGGPRGPTLLEDFHLREKIMRFDHERIPERVVHARGSGAHGYFQVYEPQKKLTKAAFLQDPSVKTPVFVRFSTVVGSRGSADTARDVRGFATKFYTSDGNFDLVGNNMPVFFIQDGIKFPDLVHAVKPEPDHEMPGAASAHDSFWDFVSLVPESAHMIMWVMSDRAIPRSYAMMEGFGVHTFRLVDDAGGSRLVKFHWKPLLGKHSLVWDEAQKLAGKDPDFHRRDLWEAIDRGDFPEYELGVQVVAEADEHKYGFDMLDPTKLLPEELVPVQKIGKMVLDRNPDNFFAETEQVAYCVANVVPGIDVTNDPLMQARLFSYLDTQLTRLGGPNFNQIPINRPVVPVHNHQQDGHMFMKVPTNKANYHPNSLGGGMPALASPKTGYVHHPEKVDGRKVRERSASFADHYSQAKLFFDSLSKPERQHLVEALQFELGKVVREEIRSRMLGVLSRIDAGLAKNVSQRIGVPVPPLPAGSAPAAKTQIASAPSLSLMSNAFDSIKARKVAFLVADGTDGAQVASARKALEAEGAVVELVAWNVGDVKLSDGTVAVAKKSFLTGASVFYDAIHVPGGQKGIEQLLMQGDAIHFINEAFRHCKPLGATAEGVDLLTASRITGVRLAEPAGQGIVADHGVVTTRSGDAGFAKAFRDAIAAHRHFDRDQKDRVPA